MKDSCEPLVSYLQVPKEQNYPFETFLIEDQILTQKNGVFTRHVFNVLMPLFDVDCVGAHAHVSSDLVFPTYVAVGGWIMHCNREAITSCLHTPVAEFWWQYLPLIFVKVATY